MPRRFPIKALLLIGVSLLAAIRFWPFLRVALRLSAAAGILAFLLLPLCRVYEKKLSPAPAALLALGTGLIAAGGIGVPVAAFLVGRMGELPDLAERSLGQLPLSPQMREKLLAGAQKALQEFAAGKSGQLLKTTLSGASAAAGAAAFLAAAALIAFYCLKERKTLLLRLELLAPGFLRERVVKAGVQATGEVWTYLKGQMLIALCVGALSALALFLIGVPGGIWLGLLAGVLNLIPYLGPVIACVPTALCALPEGLLPAAMAVLALIAVQQIDGLVLSPRIVGSATGFSPAVVLLALFSAGAAWSVKGMLLVMPTLILIRTCVRVFVESEKTD